MNESPWAVAYHADTEDEDESVRAPAEKTSKEKSEKQAEAPVGLVLSLPQPVVDAMSALVDRLTRVAVALEENTKAMEKLAKAAQNHEI